MRGLADIYATLLRTDMAVMLQYRAAMLIWLLGLVLQPVIYLVVWLTVAASQGGQVGGFTGADLAAYYIAMMLVNHAPFTWHMWEMGWRVRSGSFNPLLVQPLHPIHRDIVENVGYKAITLIVVVPAAGLLVWFFEPAFHSPAWALAALVPALVLAFLLRFFLEWSLGLLAFWITDTSGLYELYMAGVMFLAGRMAPLELMPGWVQQLAAVLPFRWMVAFPVELALGRLTPVQARDGLLVQSVWLAVGLGVLSLAWGRAVRRYSAVGN
ncbi:MAG: ABC-2 family transporter protein [Gemmatimonadota bacterium]